MTVADTDVLIDFLSNRGAGAARIAEELEPGQLATTAINRFGLLAGVRTRKRGRSGGNSSHPGDEKSAALRPCARCRLRRCAPRALASAGAKILFAVHRVPTKVDIANKKGPRPTVTVNRGPFSRDLFGRGERI
jgi:hypothetical protein